MDYEARTLSGINLDWLRLRSSTIVPAESSSHEVVSTEIILQASETIVSDTTRILFAPCMVLSSKADLMSCAAFCSV